MRVIYELNAREPVPLRGPVDPVQVGDVEVEWVVQGADLTRVRLVFRGQPIARDSGTGAIVFADKARDLVAGRVARFVADAVFGLTGRDSLAPDEIGQQVPRCEGETAEEAAVLPVGVLAAFSSLRATGRVVGPLDPAKLARGVTHTVAVAHFARAKRAVDSFDRYDKYFKVVEVFAVSVSPGRNQTPKLLKGPALDRSVSAQVVTMDEQYTPTAVAELRELRNRITHPRARLGHLSPHDVDHIAEVQARLPLVERLATLLLWERATS